MLAGLGLSVLMRLLLPTKPFLWTWFNHFSTTVVQPPFNHSCTWHVSPCTWSWSKWTTSSHRLFG